MPAKKVKKITDEGKPLSKSAIRRQRERELRYKTILSSAETLFSEVGYHDTSMERIADSAEVSVGAVYFYFKNKEDLLAILIDESAYKLRATLGQTFLNSSDTLEGFKKAGHSFFEDFCVNYPEKVAILFRESVGQGQLLEERRKVILKKLIKDIEGALARVCESLGIKLKNAISSEVIAVSIMGIYERVAYHYIFSDNRADIKEVGLNAVDFLIGGIQNLIEEK